jgi:hypothetical protein
MATPICETLKQNQRLYQIQNPPTRLETVNPYLSSYNPSTKKPFTAFDFNMRRKVEILKYAPNKQSSQTNSLTKSQKWGQIVRGNFQSESYTKVVKSVIIKGKNVDITYLNGKQVDPNQPYIAVLGCPPTRSQLTSSTACDVPGTPINLYEDDNVPLYNYATNTNSFAFENVVTSPNWYIESYSNITSAVTMSSAMIPSFSSNLTTPYTIPVNIASLYIVSPTYAVTTFNMTIPIGFYLAGDVSNNISYMTTNPILMNINNIVLNVFANNKPIILSQLPTFTFNYSVNSVFDISINIPASMSNRIYSIGQYVGSVTVSNIVLPTASGNIYDFQLTYMLDISNIPVAYTSSINNTVAGVISNITANLVPNNAVSSIILPVPEDIPSATSYKVIENPTNGFAFAEK